MPQSSAMTCLEKVPRPNACLDTVLDLVLAYTRLLDLVPFLATVPQLSAMICLEKVTQPSAMPRLGDSA